MDDRLAINLAKTAIRDAYGHGDVDALLAQYSPGYTDLSDGFPSVSKADALDILKQRLTLLFATYEVESSPATIDIQVYGETAIALGWHRLTLRPKAGGPAAVHRTRYLELWKRSEGAWQLALTIDNRNPAPQLAQDTLAKLLSGELDPLNGTSRQPPQNSTDKR